MAGHGARWPKAFNKYYWDVEQLKFFGRILGRKATVLCFPTRKRVVPTMALIKGDVTQDKGWISSA